MDNEFDLAPVSPFSATGMLWDLHEDAFLRWWRSLPSIDRSEFADIHRGDEILARFVCAVWYLGWVQQQGYGIGVIIEAYGKAMRMNPMSPECRAGAYRAWRHDAVQMLLGRLRSHSGTEAKARIMNSVSHLIETALHEAREHGDLKEKAVVINAALKFAQMIESVEADERKDRRKRGMQTIKTVEQLESTAPPNEAQLKLMLAMAKEAFGAEKLKELTGGE